MYVFVNNLSYGVFPHTAIPAPKCVMFPSLANVIARVFGFQPHSYAAQDGFRAQQKEMVTVS